MAAEVILRRTTQGAITAEVRVPATEGLADAEVQALASMRRLEEALRPDQKIVEDLGELIVQTLGRHGPCSANQLCSRLGGRRGDVFAAVRDLASAGRLVRYGSGRATRWALGDSQ